MPEIRLEVNGRQRTLTDAPGLSALDALREQLGLIGAKYGCGEGVCGTCTVLVDGVPSPACVTPAASLRGKKVVTIEGLANGDKLHPVQEAFLQESAFQCGYCTPGMILAAVALLRKKPDPTEAEIRAELEGHICRCGAYPRIVKAVRAAALELRIQGASK